MSPNKLKTKITQREVNQASATEIQLEWKFRVDAKLWIPAGSSIGQKGAEKN